MDDAVRIVTTAQTPTAVVAETTSWDEFPRLWRGLLAKVSGPFAARGRVVASALPAGWAATAVARGEPSPASLAIAHSAVREWCAANGRDLTGVRWEIYGHWRDDQDPALFETEVYWLLAE